MKGGIGQIWGTSLPRSDVASAIIPVTVTNHETSPSPKSSASTSSPRTHPTSHDDATGRSSARCTEIPLQTVGHAIRLATLRRHLRDPALHVAWNHVLR